MSHLQALIDSNVVWRARDLTDSVAAQQQSSIPTGFADLDRLLPGQGWPRDALVEIFVDTYGQGELRLLIAGLRHLLNHEARWLAWVNPPFVPYAPALDTFGIDTNRLLLVHPKNHQEALWATEKILESGSVSAALAWLHEKELNEPHLRRIQTRAKEGNVWMTLFRPLCARRNFSPAELRLSIDKAQKPPGDQLKLSILKRKGGWQVNGLALPLPWQPHIPSYEHLHSQWDQWRQSNPHRGNI